MTASTVTNGKPQRKQLSDQLDRLDSILDALAEGLPGAVNDACREGACAAVKDAIIEIVTNPELRALLVSQSLPAAPAPIPEPSPAPKRPSIWDRIKAAVTAAHDAVAGVVTKVKEAMIRRFVIAGDAVVTLSRATGETLPVRRILFVSLGIGFLVGAACLIVPQTTAAVISGVGAACTAVSVQVGKWLTRTARRVGLLS